MRRKKRLTILCNKMQGHISEGTRLGNIIVFVGRSLTLDAPSDFEKKLCVV
jgi:hypothetical protein